MLREIYGYDNGVAEYQDTPIVVVNNVPIAIKDQEVLDFLSSKGYELIFEGDRFHSILSCSEITYNEHYEWDKEFINWTDII
ncbi:hypothetical protein D3C71_1560250 [compost metagenome]